MRPRWPAARSNSASSLLSIGQRLVDLKERAKVFRILVLREGVVVVHRAVAASGLEDAVIDAGIDHLGDHELGRRFDLLHADRHVLDEVVVALEGELQLPVAPDSEPDVRQARPAVVIASEEHVAA